MSGDPKPGRNRAGTVPGAKTRRDHDLTELADPAWERQKWETELGYQRFRLYRDLSLTRSLGRVAGAAKVSIKAITDMSVSNLWPERARRYDAFLDTIGRQVTESAVRAAAGENTKRIGEMQQTEWDIWNEAKTTVLSLLQAARGFMLTHKDGTEEYVPGDPRAASAAAQVLREADRVARMATGQPTEGSRPKPDEVGRESDLDAFLDQLSGGPGEPVPEGTAKPD